MSGIRSTDTMLFLETFSSSKNSGEDRCVSVIEWILFTITGAGSHLSVMIPLKSQSAVENLRNG